MKRIFTVVVFISFFISHQVYSNYIFSDDNPVEDGHQTELITTGESLSTSSVSEPTSSVENPPCPKYRVSKRTIITSSTEGQISDTGWLEDEVFESCDEVQTGELSPECVVDVIPGRSVGDGDESIQTCNYKKVDCIAECAKCEASSVETEIAITFPNIQFLKEKLEAVAEAAPMIKSFEFNVGGSIAKKTGEECCLDDKKLPAVKYEDYSGTVSAGLSITLNVPGWSWKLNQKWQGIYRVEAEISLGPSVTLSPSASASIAGRKYDQNKCPACVTTSATGSVGVGVAFGGNLTCNVWLFEGRWFEMSGQFQLMAELSLNTSISLSGKYDWQGCPKPGLSGSFGYGSLTGTAKAGVTVFGTEISFSKTVTILDGATYNF